MTRVRSPETLVCMCGISGLTGSNPYALRRMHAALRHRGPDDQGFFETSQMSVAHNRLAILDTSVLGHQPMTTQDGRWTIVFNGEIYNFKEVRAELEVQGAKFRSQSDTEVLLAAWLFWGEACLKRLNGMFAFAIWDAQDERLWLVRDPVGIKPLYYARHENMLWFASEIKALRAVGIGNAVDPEAFQSYVRLLYVPGPRTMMEGVYRLLAGQLLEWHNGQSIVRAWTTWQEPELFSSIAEAREAVHAAVLSAVKRQLISDRPLGVFLSGGIDSSLVACAMRQMKAGTIRTFSVSYASDDQSEKYNADARAAAETARIIGAEHHEVHLEPDDALACFEDVIRHMDEPIANHVQTSTFLLAKFAQSTITVALGGDGGDELFGGYPRYWWSAQIERFQRIPIPWRAAWLRRLADCRGYAHAWRLCTSLPGPERWAAFATIPDATVGMIAPHHTSRAWDPYAVLPASMQDVWRDQTNGLMASDVATWLPEESLMRTDKMTMAHGLEERVPLLDLELCKLAWRIPSAWKIDQRNQGKRLLIDACRDLLPTHVLHQEKRAWMSPAAKWLRGPWQAWARERIEHPAPGVEQWYDTNGVREVFDAHVSKRQYGLQAIWGYLTFEAWYRTVFKHL